MVWWLYHWSMTSEGTIASPHAAGEDIFSRVISGRASELIVDQIRLLIRDGSLKAGDRLPAERELGEKFGVSRVTVAGWRHQSALGSGQRPDDRTHYHTSSRAHYC